VDPPHATGTLVTWEVDTLDRRQQALLLRWMDSHAADVQVISVAPCPVFPLVLEGTFLPTLYYRLNTVCLARPDTPNVAFDGRSLEKAERERRGAVGFTFA
jgi:transcriptional regulator of acetoin/glycerol metabolism